MSVSIGTQLGQYEITAFLGNGGMGEVYRARDLKLKREVAIKTLPDEFSKDPDRIVRFQREAEALAALNHPNIGSIYDLQEVNGSRFLVLELVEGDTLADVLAKRGLLPIGETLNIVKQICDALEAAHEKGIVHRDLKPSNIKINPDGKVKLLDFGLAQMFESGAPPDPTNSPTMMSRSMPGVVVGTPAYMSPEQVRGEMTDHRSDVWAFGCLFYELLTARPAFSGSSVTDVLASVLRDDPARNLKPDSSRDHRRLVTYCLQKEVRRRLQHIRDARLFLDDDFEPARTNSAPPRRWRTALTIAIFLVLLAIAAISLPPRVAQTQPVWLSLNAPEGTAGIVSGSVRMSPSGRRVAFAAKDDAGISHLWVRSLGSMSSQKFDNTAGARAPFWSPDERFLGFSGQSKLEIKPKINRG